MATEARQVLARGVEVVLGDGEPRLLRFDLDALEVIETDWGSIADFSAALHKAVMNRFRTNRVKVVRAGLRAALTHLQLSEAELSLLVTFAQVDDEDVIAAIGAAWLEGVPVGGSTGKVSAEQSASTGPSSTTSAPSDTAAPTRSSAA